MINGFGFGNGMYLVADVTQFAVERFVTDVKKKPIEVFAEGLDLISAGIGFAGCMGYSHIFAKNVAEHCKKGKNLFKMFYFPASVIVLPKITPKNWTTAFNVSEYFRKAYDNALGMVAVLGAQERTELRNIFSITTFTSGLLGFLKPEDAHADVSSQSIVQLKGWSQFWDQTMKISLFALGIIGVMNFIPAAFVAVGLTTFSSLSFGGLSASSALAIGSSIVSSSMTMPILLLIARVSNLFKNYTQRSLESLRCQFELVQECKARLGQLKTLLDAFRAHEDGRLHEDGLLEMGRLGLQTTQALKDLEALKAKSDQFHRFGHSLTHGESLIFLEVDKGLGTILSLWGQLFGRDFQAILRTLLGTLDSIEVSP